jgi:hypothetical protein
MGQIVQYLRETDQDNFLKFLSHAGHRPLAEIAIESEPSLSVHDEIFHYTSLKSVFLIFDVGSTEVPKLRYSTLSDVNDSTELNYGAEILANEFERQSAPRRLIEMTKDLHLKKQEFGILSLSAENDSIPLWLAYGERGSGAAIGFSVQTLLTATRCSLVPVVYEKATQKEIFANFVALLCRHLSDDFLAKQKTGALDNLQRVIATAALMAKHPSWSFEKEWRLVIRNVLQKTEYIGESIRRVGYSTRKDMSCEPEQYYEDKFINGNYISSIMVCDSLNPVTQIMLGKRVAKSQYENLRFHLDERKLSDVQIVESNCSLK